MPPTKGEHARPATMASWDAAFARTDLWTAFEEGFANGGSLAVGDVDGDGQEEVLVGAGPGRLPEVQVYLQDGTLMKTFRAYPEWFYGGVRVATADLDGDGRAEIVTAPGPGAGPHVRVWDHRLEMQHEFFAYGADMTDGVTVATVRTPAGSRVLTGVESWTSPLVRRFTADGRLEKEFYAYDAASRSGVSVAAWDIDRDGNDEIVTTQNGGTSADLRVYDIYGTLFRQALVMDPEYRGAVRTAVLGSRLLTMPHLPTVIEVTEHEKQILVDLSQQRLYALERGRMARSFLVSTGLPQFATPTMSVAVREKIPVKTYRWSYGPGNPNNYDLPGVEWNLRINGPYYIHYAYWHNNFGNRMSHGCINVGRDDAEWIYNWSDVGVKVDVVS